METEYLFSYGNTRIWSFDWQPDLWKEELRGRFLALKTYEDFLRNNDDVSMPPLSQVDINLRIFGFSIRTLCEEHLVTDKLKRCGFKTSLFPPTSENIFREPFRSSSGQRGQLYNFEKCTHKELKLTELANEIVHARQLSLADVTGQLGFLIGSDWHYKNRLIFIDFDTLYKMTDSVLSDSVTTKFDYIDASGKNHSQRE